MNQKKILRYLNKLEFSMNDESVQLMIDLASTHLSVGTYFLDCHTAITNLTGERFIFINSNQSPSDIWEDFISSVIVMMDSKKEE